MKKGQITLFILLLIVVIGVFVFLTQLSSHPEITQPADTDNIQFRQYVKSCIESTAREALLNRGPVEEKIEEYMNSNLVSCVDFSIWEDRGHTVSGEAPETDAFIENNVLFLEVFFPVTIDGVTISDFFYSTPLQYSTRLSFDDHSTTHHDQIILLDGDVTVEILQGTEAAAGGREFDDISVKILDNPDVSEGPDSVIYRMEPHGAIFNPPLRVSIKYNEEFVGNEHNLRLMWFDELEDEWKPHPTIVYPESNTMLAIVSHFSDNKAAEARDDVIEKASQSCSQCSKEVDPRWVGMSEWNACVGDTEACPTCYPNPTDWIWWIEVPRYRNGNDQSEIDKEASITDITKLEPRKTCAMAKQDPAYESVGAKFCSCKEVPETLDRPCTDEGDSLEEPIVFRRNLPEGYIVMSSESTNCVDCNDKDYYRIAEDEVLDVTGNVVVNCFNHRGGQICVITTDTELGTPYTVEVNKYEDCSYLTEYGAKYVEAGTRYTSTTSPISVGAVRSRGYGLQCGNFVTSLFTFTRGYEYAPLGNGDQKCSYSGHVKNNIISDNNLRKGDIFSIPAGAWGHTGVYAGKGYLFNPRGNENIMYTRFVKDDDGEDVILHAYPPIVGYSYLDEFMAEAYPGSSITWCRHNICVGRV